MFFISPLGTIYNLKKFDVIVPSLSKKSLAYLRYGSDRYRITKNGEIRELNKPLGDYFRKSKLWKIGFKEYVFERKGKLYYVQYDNKKPLSNLTRDIIRTPHEGIDLLVLGVGRRQVFVLSANDLSLHNIDLGVSPEDAYVVVDSYVHLITLRKERSYFIDIYQLNNTILSKRYSIEIDVDRPSAMIVRSMAEGIYGISHRDILLIVNVKTGDKHLLKVNEQADLSSLDIPVSLWTYD